MMRAQSYLLPILFAFAGCSAGPDAAQREPASDIATDVVEEQLPAFPLPAPQPSARTNLPRSKFPDAASVGDIAARLSAAFERAGYDDLAYYRAPGGFAVATEPERIDDSGAPFPANQRWVFAATPLLATQDLFSDFPNGLLDRLKKADPGRYRFLVILVTTRSQTTGTQAPTFDQMRSLSTGGGDFLPPAVAAIELTPQHNVSALVYEFRRASVAAPPKLLAGGGLSARQHLSAAKLF